jgi:hypothetical protein
MVGVGSPPTWPLGECTASSPGPTKNRPLPWSAEELHGSGMLGWLLFIATEPHSLGRGSGQHRGRWIGTWPLGLLLAEPSTRVAGHPCDGDEAMTEMRKAEAGEGS